MQSKMCQVNGVNLHYLELACTHHNCFIHRQDEVVRAIQAFLAET